MIVGNVKYIVLIENGTERSQQTMGQVEFLIENGTGLSLHRMGLDDVIRQ